MITFDEYNSLLQAKSVAHKLANEEPNKRQNDQILSICESNEASPSPLPPAESIAVRSETSKQFPNASICSQLNLNSRYQNKTNRQTSNDSVAASLTKDPKSDSVILEILSSGLTGGKIERSRQILYQIEKSENVRIDKSSGRVLLHDRDAGVGIFDLLASLQATTKQLSEPMLELVRRLKLPEFLVANTYAKKAANELRRTSSPDDEGDDPTLNTSGHAKWLRLY